MKDHQPRQKHCGQCARMPTVNLGSGRTLAFWCCAHIKTHSVAALACDHLFRGPRTSGFPALPSQLLEMQRHGTEPNSDPIRSESLTWQLLTRSSPPDNCQVVKRQALRFEVFFEVFEVLIERAQPQFASNGKCGQVSVHPHLGRGQLGRRQAVPQRHRALRLIAFADLRQRRQRVDRRQRITVGKRLRAAVFQDY